MTRVIAVHRLYSWAMRSGSDTTTRGSRRAGEAGNVSIRDDVLGAVYQRFGIRFDEIGTGGGCMALQTRLESGHWLVATDEGLMSLNDRIAYESELDIDDETRPAGWSIGIYPDGGTDSDGYPMEWSGQESISDYIDYDAYASDLADAIGHALKNFFE